jgi:LysR family glycine cleavage system transcriptional activator
LESIMALRQPSLESLRVFEACARLGNYARAAEELGISQTAVGSRIRNLETDLGAILFERSGSKLKLSTVGKKLAADIAEALATIKTAIERIDNATGRRLRIGVSPIVASRWLAPRMARWDAWPTAVPAELDVGVSLQPIGKGQCDLAIRVGRGHWPGLTASLLMPIQLTPMMTPALWEALGSPRSSASLRDATLLPSEMWPRWFRETDIAFPAVKPARTGYPTPDILAESALTGAGIALLSPIFFQPLLKSARLVAPFPHVLSGPDGYYAVYHPQHRNAAVIAFLQWLQSEVIDTERSVSPQNNFRSSVDKLSSM